ncbi:hypothetical protein CLO_0300 [Clostridium botulinum E1 str. 'BoNT E Beluga']|nr:hypothetical protein CLO_0300 [Clostridium botulinum E1 str. 'BoNT E Beluga']
MKFGKSREDVKSYLLFVYGKYLIGYNILKLAIVFKGKKS